MTTTSILGLGRDDDPATRPWPRVGLIGAGRIAVTGHLPAYAAGGVPVVAICSRGGSSARTLAEQWADRWPGAGGSPRVYADAQRLAADPAVELLDLATPPGSHAALIRSLLPYGKPILVQKPLAYDLAEAEAVTAEAARAGVPLAVNHNARWSPPQQILAGWIAAGELGELVHLAQVHHFSEDVRAWYTDRDDYLFVEHGIHFLDLARRHAGRDPVAVAARAVRVPGQQARCPLAYTIMLRFGEVPAPLVAALTLYNATRSAGAWSSHWFVNGTRADASVTYTTATLHTANGHTVTHRPPGEWVPDGLLAAYTAFVTALRERTVPPHSAADHLHTLALATAAAESARHDGAWVAVPTTTTTCPTHPHCSPSQ